MTPAVIISRPVPWGRGGFFFQKTCAQTALRSDFKLDSFVKALSASGAPVPTPRVVTRGPSRVRCCRGHGQHKQHLTAGLQSAVLAHPRPNVSARASP